MSRISLLRGEILIRTLNEQTPRSLGCNRGVLPAALMGRSHGASGSSGPYLYSKTKYRYGNIELYFSRRWC